jgi:hypothetical protein
MPPLKGFSMLLLELPNMTSAPAVAEAEVFLLLDLALRLASCNLQLRFVPSKACRGSSLPHCMQETGPA